MNPLKWLILSIGWSLITTFLIWLFNINNSVINIVPMLGLIYPVIFSIITIYYAWIKNPIDKWRKK